MPHEYLKPDIANSRFEELVIAELLRETNTTKIFDLPARMLESRDDHGDLYEDLAPCVVDLIGAADVADGLQMLGVDCSTLEPYEGSFLDAIACECWALVGAWVAKVAAEDELRLRGAA